MEGVRVERELARLADRGEPQLNSRASGAAKMNPRASAATMLSIPRVRNGEAICAIASRNAA
jgi:hypothetical protein